MVRLIEFNGFSGELQANEAVMDYATVKPVTYSRNAKHFLENDIAFCLSFPNIIEP